LLVANEKIVFKRARLSVNHSQQELLFEIKKKNRANELIISNKKLLFKMKKKRKASAGSS
jgi:hypothetical protein